MNWRLERIGLLAVVALVVACSRSQGPSAPLQAKSSTAPVREIEVLEKRPHDTRAFTQGFLWRGDELWESTGQYGESELRQLDPISGLARRGVRLADSRLFGEGLALHEGRLYQLTWKSGICFVWDPDSLEKISQFRYDGEGWGLTSDGIHLWMSNGSSTLQLRDPDTFDVLSQLQVTDGGGDPVDQLNELEWVEGVLLANIWQSSRIAVIDPKSGHVLYFLNASALPLSEDAHAGQDVLNGIAWHPNTGSLWLTGKYWRAMYRIRFSAP